MQPVWTEVLWATMPGNSEHPGNGGKVNFFLSSWFPGKIGKPESVSEKDILGKKLLRFIHLKGSRGRIYGYKFLK